MLWIRSLSDWDIKKYYFNLLDKESFKIAIDKASHPILTKGIDDLRKTFSTKSSLKDIYTQLEKAKWIMTMT